MSVAAYGLIYCAHGRLGVVGVVERERDEVRYTVGGFVAAEVLDGGAGWPAPPSTDIYLPISIVPQRI